jgi:2-polyprenyl-3-methyl-5-hydroxy-6-metoxy-1,4-benzoquinol methylase
MHSGMRAYTRRALLTLPFLGYPEGFSFDAALLVDAVTCGLRVVEVPIPTRYTKESSSISISRSLQYVFDGTRYAASASIARGRRGRRYVPGAARRARRIKVDEAPPPACPACGSTDLRPRYASTADPTPRAQEFACTAGALGSHDTIARCNRCGLMVARPFMPAGALHSFYELADDPTYLDEEQVRRASFSWLLARIESYHTSGRNLLELGSHVGLFLSEASAAGWTASGVEPSLWAVKEGRQRYDVELDQGTAEDVDRPSGSVDVLAMFEVLDHVADPLTVLRRSRTWISPEGLLAASVANTRGPHARLSGSRWPWYMRAHRTYLTPSTLALMLDRAGFRLTAWQRVPKSMHLSYIGKRAAGQEPYGSVGILARYVDPRVPVGWLGDSFLFVARPT